MKRLIYGTFLLTVLGLFTARHLLFMSYVQSLKNDFKQEAIHRNSENCFSLVLPISALFQDRNGMEWKNKGKELIIQGIYHEVLSLKTHDDKVELCLVEDRYETELMAGFYKKLGNTLEYGLFLLTLDLSFYQCQYSFNINTAQAESFIFPSSNPFLIQGFRTLNFIPPET